MVRVNKITDVFKEIVNKNIQFNGYDDDPLDKVMAITYEDNYPSNFSLSISVTSASKVYYCIVTDYPYSGDTSSYSNFIDYLLLDSTEYKATNSDCELYPHSIASITINTSKSVNRYVIGETSSEPKDNYLYGFYKENDEFYVYQDKPVTDGVDPFVNNANQVINNNSLL